MGSRWTEQDVQRLIINRGVRAKPIARRRPRAVAETQTPKPAPFDAFMELLRAHGLPAPEQEQMFAQPRRWRADYIWRAPHRLLIVEREGGIWSKDERAKAAHAKPLKILRDMEKANAAQMLGYIYLRFQPCDLDKGNAIPMIRAILKGG